MVRLASANYDLERERVYELSFSLWNRDLYVLNQAVF